MNLRYLLVAATIFGGIGAGAPAHAESEWMKQLAKSCDAGDATDCGSLGDQLALGIFRPADLPGARQAYDKGCKLGGTTACVGLYKMLALGRGGPRDLQRAKELEPKACNTGIIAFEVSLEQEGLCKK